MTKPRTRTSRRRVKDQPLGVAERVGTAPPSAYVHGRTGHTRPAGADTYPLDGTEHRYDGKCHPECPNVR